MSYSQEKSLESSWWKSIRSPSLFGYPVGKISNTVGDPPDDSIQENPSVKPVKEIQYNVNKNIIWIIHN